MTKILFPALLVATIMVAGIFAFMPVEQASTVHTSSTSTLAASSITASVIDADAIGTSELATAVHPLSNVLRVTYTGADANKSIEINGGGAPFIMTICGNNTVDGDIDTLTIERGEGGTTDIMVLRIDGAANSNACATIGGTAGQVIEITSTQASGATTIDITVLTIPGKTLTSDAD